MQPSTRLSIDLGTTHTVAVVRRADQQPRNLLFDGTPLLPSGVYVDVVGTVHTGRDAQRLGTSEPHRYEPYPKRRVDEGTVLLGAIGVPVAELLAAVLRRVAVEAGQAGVMPGSGTVLTCPADWGQPRREVLRDAARRAGLGHAVLVDEPVAAATYCVDVLGQQVPVGAALAVFDFGGGTLDVAVVRREPTGFRLLGTGGLDDLGGVDIDAALVGHLGQLIATLDPPLWRRLSAPDNTGELRDRLAFWAEVRAAKEMLSRTSSTPVHVPGRDEPMHLTRYELERVAGPLVARAVDETRRVIERVGVTPAALLLVGGTSRLPLVASRLHARLGVPPSVPEQPELPVAYGGLLVNLAEAPTSPSYSGTPPVSPPYGIPPVGPDRAPAASGPVSASPWGPEPVSPPLGLAPQAPSFPPRQPLVPTVVHSGRRRSRRRTVFAVAAAALAVAIVVTAVSGGTRWLSKQWQRTVENVGSGLGSNLGGGDRSGTFTRTHDVPLTGAGAVALAATADTVFYAVVSPGGTEVVALPSGEGNEKWRTKLTIEPTKLGLTVVGGLLVVDGDGSVLDDGDDVRAVVDAANGTMLWKGKWEERRDVAYLGTDVVVEARRPKTLIQRVDLKTGKVRWSRPGPDDLLIIDEWRASAMRSWPASGEPGPAELPPTGGSMYDTMTAGTDVVELNEDNGLGYLLDTASGRPKANGALPLDDELWVAFDGLAIGKLSDEASAREAVAAYRVDRFSKAWQFDGIVAGTTVERVKPCGPHRVCVALSGGDADRVVALDTANGKEVWHKDVEWSDEPGWYACGDRLLFGDATFDTVVEPVVLDTGGQVVHSLGKATAMAVHNGRLVLRDVQAGLGGSRWALSIVDIATGRRGPDAEIGSTDGEVPLTFTVGGETAAVVTGDRHVAVFRVGGLG